MGLTLATSVVLFAPTNPATAQDTGQPVIERIEIGGGSTGSIEGVGAPGAHVVVRANDRLVGHSVANADGKWRVALTRPLDAGDYRITVTSRVLGIDRDVPGQEMRIAVPADGGLARASLPRVAGIGEEEQLRRAGALAEAATKRFDELLPAQKGSVATPPSSNQAAPAAPAVTTERIVVAQAQPPQAPSPSQAAPAAKPAEDDFLAPVWDWLERSNRQYQSIIVKQLSQGEAATSLAMPQPTGPAAPSARPGSPPSVASTPKATQPSTAVGQSTVAQAPATTPAAPTPAAPKAVAQAPTTPSAPPSAPQVKAPTAPAPIPVVEKDFIDQAQDTISDWLDRANRQYQSVIVRRLSDPSPPDSAAAVAKLPPIVAPPVSVQPSTPVASAPAQPKAVEDAARLAEQQRRDAEAKRLLDIEAKRVADAKTKADDDARRVAAAAKTKADEDARLAAAKAKADEDARLAAAKAKADEEARLAAAKTKAEEDARRVAAAAKAKADEDARLAATKAKADEDARLAATKAKADEDARLAAAKAKADEDRRIAEARARSDTESKAAAVAAAAAAAAAIKAENDIKAAQARAADEAKRIADSRRVAEAAAAKAQSQAERQAAEAARAAQAKADAAKKAAETPRVAEAAPPATKPATTTTTTTKRANLQRTVRPSTRFASDNTGKRRVASSNGSLRYAKASMKRSTCTRMAGVAVRPGNWYVVKRGDTLWHIARTHYANGSKFRLLRQTNQSRIESTGIIYPCQRILIPRIRNTSSA